MDIVSLAFFAKIFNLNEADLSWGFAFASQQEKHMTTAIIVKNKQFYVDVEEGKLKRYYQRGTKQVKLFPAQLSKKGNRYYLVYKNKGCELHMSFTATDLKNLYADRCDVHNL